MTGQPANVRQARPEDAVAIAQIYNQGINDRSATFETQLRNPEDILSWLNGQHPIMVVEHQGEVCAFAASSAYRPRSCYAGIAEFSVYVRRDRRGKGYGKEAMQALIAACQQAGFWKLLSRVFPENQASLGLLASLGFREVGLYKRHAQLDGIWRDVVIVEKLL